jgi:hypothetical protein
MRMVEKLATAFDYIAQDTVAWIKGAFSRMSFFPTGFGIVNTLPARRRQVSRSAPKTRAPD